MPRIEIEVPDEHVARKIVGLVKSGRPTRLILHFRARRIVRIEAGETWYVEESTNGYEIALPFPLASGIMVAAAPRGEP